MRTLAGIALFVGLFYPGILAVQWLSENVLGIYDHVTLTDGCLAMIMLLLCINLMHQRRPNQAARRNSRPTHVDPYADTDVPPPGRLRYLSGAGTPEEQPAPRPRRKPTGRRPTRGR